MNKSYAGIGSRSTPANICELMQRLGQKLALKGIVLRSGGAKGADTAFESGCDRVSGDKIIFTATDWYQNSDVYEPRCRMMYNHTLWQKAVEIASNHHPSWSHLKPYTKRLHTRNCFQMLGISLQEPADFVICWTPDGARTTAETSQNTGGTGQAIRVASSYEIKVWNLAVKEDFGLTKDWVD